MSMWFHGPNGANGPHVSNPHDHTRGERNCGWCWFNPPRATCRVCLREFYQPGAGIDWYANGCGRKTCPDCRGTPGDLEAEGQHQYWLKVAQQKHAARLALQSLHGSIPSASSNGTQH